MSYAAGDPASVVYAAVLANAVKACGTIVTLAEHDFLRILASQESPLVVFAKGGFFDALQVCDELPRPGLLLQERQRTVAPGGHDPLPKS